MAASSRIEEDRFFSELEKLDSESDLFYEPSSSDHAISTIGHGVIPSSRQSRASFSAHLYKKGHTEHRILTKEKVQDVLARKLDELRAGVYSKYPPEKPSNGEVMADDWMTEPEKLQPTSSRPEENTIEDLNEYIQGQLKGKSNGKKSSKQQLVPVPIRYQRSAKARSKQNLKDPHSKPRIPVAPALFEFGFPDENPSKDRRLLDEFLGRGNHAPPFPKLDQISLRTAQLQQEELEREEKELMNGKFQRIFPEDPTWKLGIIERLSETCLKSIQMNFQDMPYLLAALPVEIQQRFLPELPTASETNLYLAADYFHNEDYWEKSCKLRWGRNSFPHLHGSWKLTYIEKGFQDLIMNYVPLQSDPNILLNDLLNIGEYVLQLKIDQLLPPVRHTFGDFAAMLDAQLTNHVKFSEPYEEVDSHSMQSQTTASIAGKMPLAKEVKEFVGEDAMTSTGFPAVRRAPWSEKATIKFQKLINRELDFNRGVDEGDRILMNITRELDDSPAHPRTVNPFLGADHMNLVPVVANMPHLMDLELHYGVRECGMNFSWRLFQFTLNDAKRLAEALMICPSLRRLCLSNCRITDNKGAIVCRALMDHPNLAILELQCNELGDETAAVIGRLIKRSEVLNKVDLANNDIREEGAKSLAKALVRGISLRVLNLHLNHIGDRGAEAIFLVTKSCITFLEQVVLSANHITGAIIDLLTDSMKSNKRLEKYDLSVNELEGTIVSRKLQEALSHSPHIQQFSLQENHFPMEFEAVVEELLSRNQETRLERVMVDMENTFSFNIKNVRFPVDENLMSSEDEMSVSELSSSEDEEGSHTSQKRSSSDTSVKDEVNNESEGSHA